MWPRWDTTAAANSWQQPLLMAAWGLTFCPVISVMGAKRPQDKPWNFIVASLWCVVALPAAENYLLHPGQRLELGLARGCMLWILILLAPINFLPTVQWPTALLLAGAQTLALARYLPGLNHLEMAASENWHGVGLVLLLLVSSCAWLCDRRAAGARQFESSSFVPLGPTGCWLLFRNRFGLLWSLRFIERVNATAHICQWPLVLTWAGFCQHPSGLLLTNADWEQLSPEVLATLRQTMHSLLRRFFPASQIALQLKLPVESSTPNKLLP